MGGLELFNNKNACEKSPFDSKLQIKRKRKYMFDWSLETLFEYMSIKGYETYIHHADDQLKPVPCIQ